MFLFYLPSTDTTFSYIYPLSLHDALPISITPLIASPCDSPNVVSINNLPNVFPAIEDVLLMYNQISASNLLIIDRKSTRLNSSHVSNSYAVFCLKRKKSRG